MKDDKVRIVNVADQVKVKNQKKRKKKKPVVVTVEVKQCPNTARIFRIPKIEQLPLNVCTGLYVYCDKCEDYHRITKLVERTDL